MLVLAVTPVLIPVVLSGTASLAIAWPVHIPQGHPACAGPSFGHASHLSWGQNQAPGAPGQLELACCAPHKSCPVQGPLRTPPSGLSSCDSDSREDLHSVAPPCPLGIQPRSKENASRERNGPEGHLEWEKEPAETGEGQWTHSMRSLHSSRDLNNLPRPCPAASQPPHSAWDQHESSGTVLQRPTSWSLQAPICRKWQR